jgi:hypothetical protein
MASLAMDNRNGIIKRALNFTRITFLQLRITYPERTAINDSLLPQAEHLTFYEQKLRNPNR